MSTHSEQSNLSRIPLPKPIQLTGILKTNWEKFRQVWDSYEIITKLDQSTDKIRIAHFITAIGPEALYIHNGLPFKSDEDKKSFTVILDLWERYCVGQTNVTYERYKFNNCVQQGETFDNFYVKLRTLAATCGFGELTDDLIRDRIVCGITDNTTRKRLLQEPKLTLSKCLDLCRANEASKVQFNAMSNDHTATDSTSVHVVYQKKGKQNPQKYSIECLYCGRKHKLGRANCPAYGKECKKCGKANHFAEKCKQGVKSSGQTGTTSKYKPRKNGRVHTVDENDSSESEEECICVTLEEIDACVVNQGAGDLKNKIFASMEIRGLNEPMNMQIDSGATCNVMPARLLPQGTTLDKGKHKLCMYNKETMPVEGMCKLHLRNPKNNKKYLVNFVVIRGQAQSPLLGARTAQQMKLIEIKYNNIVVVRANTHTIQSSVTARSKQDGLTRDEMLQDYANVFDGLGLMPGQVHLNVDSDTRPAVMPPRRVPIAIKPKLKDELQRLEELDMIEKVTGPTDWVSSLVTVVKPSGKLRLCIDPQHLNMALKREHYPLPVIEDVLPQLAKVKVFSKADLKEGFLQCKLDDESACLTTFQTPWGRYQWRRLPFGLSPSPELFQVKLDQCLEGLSGIHVIADDILITGQGDTKEEACRDHDQNMKNFLTRCREKNIKLNKNKFEFKCDDVTFIGHRLTQSGLKQDPNKVESSTQHVKLLHLWRRSRDLLEW